MSRIARKTRRWIETIIAFALAVFVLGLCAAGAWFLFFRQPASGTDVMQGAILIAVLPGGLNLPDSDDRAQFSPTPVPVVLLMAVVLAIMIIGLALDANPSLLSQFVPASLLETVYDWSMQILFVVWGLGGWVLYIRENSYRRDVVTDLSQLIHDYGLGRDDLRRSLGYDDVEEALSRNNNSEQ